jgi:hypothetical protein
MSLLRSKRDKETQRFYLLPGQGGEAYRRKQKFILKWTIIAALVGGAIFSLLMYWFDSVKF